MNRIQRTALLAFFLLILMAFAGWLFGGKKSNPADAAPDVLTLDVSKTKTIWLLPEDQRKHYVSADRFRAQPVANPFDPVGGRPAGGVVEPSPVSNLGGGFNPAKDPVQVTPASSRSVRVRQGQTLSHVAQEQLGNARLWRELAAFNKLGKDGQVTFGQLIYLPEAGQVLPQLNPEPQPQPIPGSGGEFKPPQGTRQHTVARGEYLGGISSRYYGTSKETKRILAANNLKNEDQIRAGQVLLIPPRN
jgi:nucleoid-associated protein YgaU